METTVDIDLDDEDLWNAVQERVREEAEQAAQDYCEYNLEIPVVHDEVESLLREFKGRLTAEDGLCGIGTLAREVIELVARPLVAEPFPVADPNVAQLAEFQLKARVDDLETQVNTLLEIAQQGGERAASVDRRD